MKKVLYYVTDHGLGHATRTVAVVRELLKRNAKVTIRSNDPRSFFKRSLPDVQTIPGMTDFVPVMDKNNYMRIDGPATQKNVAKWIDVMPSVLENESTVVQKERPDVIVSDISIMPILLAKRHRLKSVAISNFIWSDTLPMDKKSQAFFVQAYAQADLIARLPFGSQIDLPNRVDSGLVARSLTQDRNEVRKQLGVTDNQILVTMAIGKMQGDRDIKVVDVSNYAGPTRPDSIFVEGQNLINASDFVVCKCGYGFVSECVAYGTKFLYALEWEHREARYIHEGLAKIGLGGNMITAKEAAGLGRARLEKAKGKKMLPDNSAVASLIEKL